MKCGCAYSRLRSKSGFTLAEIMLSLFFVTLAIVLVGGLAQQVASFSKRSAQTGAILEMRNMANAITRNSDNWLNAMRSSTHTNGLYAGCIPDPKSNISTFSCPATDASLLNDNDLKEIAENGTYHILSSPLVNASGELIAGSEAAPVFYTSEGRVCTDTDTSKCPLKSTGYFMRSNSNTSQDPGSIKFVIKIERNAANVGSNTAPMKAQYITMDMGDDWKTPSFASSCPAGTIKVGYLSNGNPSCINPISPCADPSQIAIGLDSSGKSICKSLPNCSASGGHIVLNSAGNDIVCSTSSPCGANKLFLGFFAGSGEPMCSSSSMKCASGQVQTGITLSGGNMVAECEALPTCTLANTRLSFDGTKFVCEASANAISCGTDQVMTGINADGSPNCIERAPASTTTTTTTTSGGGVANYIDTFHESAGSPWLSGGATGVIPVNGTKSITIPLGDAAKAKGLISTSYLDTVNSFDWLANFTLDTATGDMKFSMSGLHWADSGSFNIKNTWKAFATDFGENPYNGVTTKSYPAAPAAKAYRTVEVYYDSTAKELRMKLSAAWYRIDTYQVVVDKFAPATGGAGCLPKNSVSMFPELCCSKEVTCTVSPGHDMLMIGINQSNTSQTGRFGRNANASGKNAGWAHICHEYQVNYFETPAVCK